ncbi:MAG TPA: hypothetical protein ENI23_11170 [bacterium]|nr:hypothetical protein [bacterium]
MVQINWTIEGEKQLSRRLTKLGKNVEDFRPEFRKSTRFLKGFFGREVFISRGSMIGERWKTRKRSYGWPILERSGKMRKGFRDRTEKLSGEVWNAVDYFKYHQSNMPRRVLPRRVMMKLTDRLKNKIVSIFHEGLWKRVDRT